MNSKFAGLFAAGTVACAALTITEPPSIVAPISRPVKVKTSPFLAVQTADDNSVVYLRADAIRWAMPHNSRIYVCASPIGCSTNVKLLDNKFYVVQGDADYSRVEAMIAPNGLKKADDYSSVEAMIAPNGLKKAEDLRDSPSFYIRDRNEDE